MTVRDGRLAFLLSGIFGAASAQRLADPARLGPSLDLLSRNPFQATLRCQMTPVRPWLNFSLRLQAGYLIEAPMDQFSTAGHELKSVTEITPLAAGARPVYLANRFYLSALPSKDAVAQMAGAYLLGAGAYNARMVVYDETGRACRAEWPVTAVWNDARLRAPIPANAVAEFHWAAVGRATEPVFDRLTVLLHTAPVDARRSQLTPEDAAMMLGGLDALLDQIPARTVRLVAFNLDQQKEGLARDGFTAAGLDELQTQLHSQQLAVVDYRVLQNRTGPMEMLANLANRETRGENAPDAVVFLGPALHTSWKLPKDAVSLQPHGPAYFYIQLYSILRRGSGGTDESIFPASHPSYASAPSYRRLPQPTLGATPGVGADPIASLVGQLKGKVFSVGTPQEFARAVLRIRQPSAGR